MDIVTTLPKVHIRFKEEEAKPIKIYSLQLRSDEPLDQLVKRVNYINEVQLIKTDDHMIEISNKQIKKTCVNRSSTSKH